MLSPTATVPTAIILDLCQGNRSAWHQALQLLCLTEFGVAGQQVLSNVPYSPSDMNQHWTISTPTSLASIPTLGATLMQSPSYRVSKETLTIGMAERHTRYHDITTPSISTISTGISPLPPTQLSKHIPTTPPIKSYPSASFLVDHSIHSVGNAATKLHRTRLYINISQGELPHKSSMDAVTTMAKTFKPDFECIEHLGYVSIPELTSYTLLGEFLIRFNKIRSAVDVVLLRRLQVLHHFE